MMLLEDKKQTIVAACCHLLGGDKLNMSDDTTTTKGKGGELLLLGEELGGQELRTHPSSKWRLSESYKWLRMRMRRMSTRRMVCTILVG